MLPGMLSRGSGRMLSLTGWAGAARQEQLVIWPPDPFAAALETAVAGLAAELAGTRVTANAYWLGQHYEGPPGPISRRASPRHASVLRPAGPRHPALVTVTLALERKAWCHAGAGFPDRHRGGWP